MIELHKLISGPYEDGDEWYNVYLIRDEQREMHEEEIYYDTLEDAYDDATWLNSNIGPIVVYNDEWWEDGSDT